MTIEGKPIKSVMDLHQQCRVVLVSSSDKFKGLQDRSFFTLGNLSVDEVKPKPSSWVNNATRKWTDTNSVGNFSNYAKTFESSFQSQSSIDDHESSVLNTVIGEHIRVHT